MRSNFHDPSGSQARRRGRVPIGVRAESGERSVGTTKAAGSPAERDATWHSHARAIGRDHREALPDDEAHGESAGLVENRGWEIGLRRTFIHDRQAGAATRKGRDESASSNSQQSVMILAMDTISLKDLQRDPAGLLDRVEAGEHLVVSREGRPVAELRPLIPPVRGPRPFGLAAGAFTVPADFDTPLPDNLLRDFEGR